jgi:hypothetical protein
VSDVEEGIRFVRWMAGPDIMHAVISLSANGRIEKVTHLGARGLGSRLS